LHRNDGAILRHTSDTVQVSQVEDIGRAALGLTTSAERKLATLEKRSSHGGGSESEDGGEEHLESWVAVLLGEKVVVED
jgi:hypothetical protein